MRVLLRCENDFLGLAREINHGLQTMRGLLPGLLNLVPGPNLARLRGQTQRLIQAFMTPRTSGASCALAFPIALVRGIFNQSLEALKELLNGGTCLAQCLEPAQHPLIKLGFGDRGCGRDTAGTISAQRGRGQGQQPLIAASGKLGANRIEQVQQVLLAKFGTTPARILLIQKIAIQDDTLLNPG